MCIRNKDDQSKVTKNEYYHTFLAPGREIFVLSWLSKRLMRMILVHRGRSTCLFQDADVSWKTRLSRTLLCRFFLNEGVAQ